MRSPLAILLATLLLTPAPGLANPKGGQVRGGSATIREGAGRVDIHQHSHSATLSWESFDIDPGEVTQFHQPGSDSVAINRILQSDASQILGSLQANGHVYLINPHGILFGREATVNVHALIATRRWTAATRPPEGFDASATAARGADHQPGLDPERAGVRLPGRALRGNGSDVDRSPEGEVMIEAGATVSHRPARAEPRSSTPRRVAAR
jgi:filamentous hemagglutinin family protein